MVYWYPLSVRKTTEYCKKCYAATVLSTGCFLTVIRLLISTNVRQNFPRMQCFHTGLFVACVQSDTATCDPWVVSCQRLGFLSRRGQEPMHHAMWDFLWGGPLNTDKDWEMNKPSSMRVHHSELNSEIILNYKIIRILGQKIKFT